MLNIAIYPVATPIIAGPGSILAIILLTDNNRFTVSEQATTLGVLAVVLSLLLLIFLMSDMISRLIGRGGTNVIRRIMGIIIAAISVNLIVSALAQWLHRYTEFLATKRGLAAALHSGDPAFDALPGYFYQRLEPALGALLEAATASGTGRAGISARDLLLAVALLCRPVPDEGIGYSQRMVAVLIDGLRHPDALRPA